MFKLCSSTTRQWHLWFNYFSKILACRFRNPDIFYSWPSPLYQTHWSLKSDYRSFEQLVLWTQVAMTGWWWISLNFPKFSWITFLKKKLLFSDGEKMCNSNTSGGDSQNQQTDSVRSVTQQHLSNVFQRFHTQVKNKDQTAKPVWTRITTPNKF